MLACPRATLPIVRRWLASIRDLMPFDTAETPACEPAGSPGPPSRFRARMPGYDVARAIALFGMVVVNFRGIFHAYDSGRPWLLWLADRLEGKAGALFVLLAGVGISLSTLTHEDADDAGQTRRALLERAAILVGVGVVLMHVWEWDILHFHGVYLLLAIPLVRARSATLWGLAFVSVWIGLVLVHELSWTERPALDTIPGAALHLAYNGLYPVFPWFAFVLVGMAVGRLDLRDPITRRRAFWIALAIACVAEGIDSLARLDRASGELGLGPLGGVLLTWPRPPRPLFVVSGSGFSIAIICACIGAAEHRDDRRWVIALVATGQLALTLYVAHVIAILVPEDHGLLRGRPIEVAILYALAFDAAAIPFAVWWRRRFAHGPVEGVIRQVLRRDRTGPRDTGLR